MTIKEKLNQLEDLLDIEKDILDEETELEHLSQWDSMAVIALIAMFDDMFEKVVSSAEVKEFKTIKDVIERME
jgi:acyl carrier protein